MEKCAKKKKKAVERKKKGLDRASIVRDGRFVSYQMDATAPNRLICDFESRFRVADNTPRALWTALGHHGFRPARAIRMRVAAVGAFLGTKTAVGCT
jgi:hypothetical protein